MGTELSVSLSLTSRSKSLTSELTGLTTSRGSTNTTEVENGKILDYRCFFSLTGNVLLLDYYNEGVINSRRTKLRVYGNVFQISELCPIFRETLGTRDLVTPY